MQSVRRGKCSFEIQMQDKSFFTFATDNEIELEEWVTALSKIIRSNDMPQPQDRARDKGIKGLCCLYAYFLLFILYYRYCDIIAAGSQAQMFFRIFF